MSGGYNLVLNRDFVIRPTALIKYASPGQIQFEIDGIVFWKRMIWGGLSYRYHDAVSILAGFNYENKIYIGISYDVTLSELRRYSAGTYEVILGYRFNSIK